VHLFRRCQLLPHRRYCIVCLNYCILRVAFSEQFQSTYQSIYSLPWSSRGMCILSPVSNLHSIDGQHVEINTRVWIWMAHHGCIHSIQSTGIDEVYLSSSIWMINEMNEMTLESRDRIYYLPLQEFQRLSRYHILISLPRLSVDRS
jgi:hypothetical protein